MIIIVGAGPVGCFLGSILAKAGKEVSIFEEHDSIGKPVHCTGIVTGELGKIIELKNEFIVNKLDKVNVYSKNSKIELPADDIVLDRAKFDRHLARMARKNGAKIYLNHKFIGIKGQCAVFANKANKIVKFKADKIIGADGPLSEVAKSNNMFGKRKFYVGMQARIKGKYDPNCYETYFGSICHGFLAWVVPESEEVARIGVASKKKTREIFRRFLDAKKVKEKNIIDYQAGPIPIYSKNIEVQRGNVFLVGDAAGHVKATTGGGIVYGFKAAVKLADCILNGKDYKKELKGLNRKLGIHLRIRKMLDKFSDKDYNKLIELLKNKRIASVLKRHNRDNPKMLVLKALIAEPRLLLYITKIC
jgi:geranylgeranyl reductase family protein